MKIEYGIFGFTIIPSEPLILPLFKGSTLRDGFDYAFKRIDTPTRIIYNGHLTIELEFHILIRIRNLIRRLSLLYYFHCGGDPSAWDFKGIIKKAEEVKVIKRNLRWHDWQRYSTRQSAKMKMGGFMGEITFKGNIMPFMSIYKLWHPDSVAEDKRLDKDDEIVLWNRPFF